MLAGLMIVFNDMTTLIDFFSFVAWIFIVLAMIVLLLLRKTRPNASRPYQVRIDLFGFPFRKIKYFQMISIWFDRFL